VTNYRRVSRVEVDAFLGWGVTAPLSLKNGCSAGERSERGGGNGAKLLIRI